MGVEEYESQQHDLSNKLIGSADGVFDPSESQSAFPDQFIYAGTYGNTENRVKTRYPSSITGHI